MSDDTRAEIRRVIAENGKLHVELSNLGDDDDLYAAGMTSHASVNLMLALEDAFDLEFPDSMLRRGVFESVSSIAEAIAALEAPPG